MSSFPGFLLLQFESHLITYAVQEIHRSIEDASACKPSGIKEVNKEVTQNLVFKPNSADFFFVNKDDKSIVGLDSLDDPLNVALNLHLNQPTAELQSFAKSVQTKSKIA